jgi:thiol-disulfide isomerase/thioredoxin
MDNNQKCTFFTGFLMVIFLLTSCKSTMSTQENDPEQPPAPNYYPAPTTYVKGIPIYDKFDDVAPIFSFNTDTTYVINFWATWCKPCVEELPYFEEITKDYKEKKVQVILVSLDFPRQIESKLVPFLEKNQLQSKVLMLKDGKFNDWIDRVSTQWDGAIPVTYIYKKDKKHFISHSVESKKELEDGMNLVK